MVRSEPRLGEPSVDERSLNYDCEQQIKRVAHDSLWTSKSGTNKLPGIQCAQKRGPLSRCEEVRGLRNRALSEIRLHLSGLHEFLLLQAPELC